MIEQDTVRLLRECDAGVKMGVDAIEQTLPHVKSAKLKMSWQRAAVSMRRWTADCKSFWTDITTTARTPIPWPRG